jgi:hypothetical protein
MRRATLVTLSFAGGPWDGRMLESVDAPAWFRLDGEGAYRLTSWGIAHGCERAGYIWQDVHRRDEKVGGRSVAAARLNVRTARTLVGVSVASSNTSSHRLALTTTEAAAVVAMSRHSSCASVRSASVCS